MHTHMYVCIYVYIDTYIRHESRSGTLWREGQGEGYEQRTAIYTCMKMKFPDFYMSHPYPK